MKKFLKVFLMLADKRFLASLFGLIAITVPVTAKWFSVNSDTLTASIAGVATTVAVILAYLSESPKQKDEKLKGGKK